MLSNSIVVSSIRALFWLQYIFSSPLIVTHNRALLDVWGWWGPTAWINELSYKYDVFGFVFGFAGALTAGPYKTLKGFFDNQSMCQPYLPSMRNLPADSGLQEASGIRQ